MKFWTLVVVIVFVNLAISLAECPAGEYEPGPDCGLEPSCAAMSSHSYPKHTCDCWCKPGTYRKLDNNACVTLSEC